MKIKVPQNRIFKGELSRIFRVIFRRKLSLTGFIFISLFFITAIFANWIAPYDPYYMEPVNQLQGPSWQHLMGTDMLGRDTLSRLIYGARTSMIVGLGAVAIGVILGQSLGLAAAYFGGLPSSIIMRCIDALMSVPGILIALIIASALGGGVKNVIVALGIAVLSGQCRLMYAQALSVKYNDFITAEQSIGVGHARMIFRHILPNAFPPLLVLITMDLGVVIISEASLSFLGLGVPSPQPAWGSMVNDGYKFLMTLPILSFGPGLACMMVVFGFSMAGDGLRDALDPRLRGTLGESSER
jgi:peptide/nickel transport system permease protein